MKAEIESERSNVEKTLNEVALSDFIFSCVLLIEILKLNKTINSIHKTLCDTLQTISAGM